MIKAVKTLLFYCVIILFIILPGNFFQLNWDSQQQNVPQTPTLNSVQLTPEERSWLDAHQPIRIAFDGYFPPYSFINESGQLAGISYDTLKLISQKINMQVEIDNRILWKEIYQAALDKKIDVIATMVNRPEREGCNSK